MTKINNSKDSKGNNYNDNNNNKENEKDFFEGASHRTQIQIMQKNANAKNLAGPSHKWRARSATRE